jgi:pimeloyl-ACP methyl ester carboxylesterase
MNKALFLALVSLISIHAAMAAVNTVPPEANYNFVELASSLNYPVEEHTVQTDDGYILTLFRIQAKNTQIRSGLPAVLLNHGLLDSSDSFIINNEEQASGLLIANAGYDVWITNNRGNKYSVGHVDPVNFNSSDANSAFWDFSWQDMSEHDLPAVIQYVAQQTDQKVNYMGHSEGTTIMFAALSRRDPTVVNNLNKFIALAPAVFLQHSSSIIVEVGGWVKAGNYLLEYGKFLDRKKFGWMSDSSRNLWEKICVSALDICIERVRLLSDAKTSVDNVHRFPITSGHYPAGSSLQNMYYWSQMFNNPDFCMYDYGTDGNIQVYGQPNPPNYDLSQITEPVYMFVGEYDELASPADTATLRSALTGSSHVEYRTYPLGHASFIWGLDVASYVKDVLVVLSS